MQSGEEMGPGSLLRCLRLRYWVWSYPKTSLPNSLEQLCEQILSFQWSGLQFVGVTMRNITKLR